MPKRRKKEDFPDTINSILTELLSDEEDGTGCVQSEEIEYRKDDFILGKMIYNFGTSKETEKKFVGQITAKAAGDRFQVSFLQKKTALKADVNEPGRFFVFPNIVDKWTLTRDQILKKIKVERVARGKYFVSEQDFQAADA